MISRESDDGETKTTSIPTRPCSNETDFQNIKESVRNNVIFKEDNELVCFDLDSVVLKGSLDLASGAEFEVGFKFCDISTDPQCRATDEVAYLEVEKYTIFVGYTQNSVDLSQFEEGKTISSVFKTLLSWKPRFRYTKTYEVSIMQNLVSLRDTLFNPLAIWSGESSNLNFQTVQSQSGTENVQKVGEVKILKSYFVMASQINIFGRQVFNIINLVAEVGGFSIVMFVVLGYIMDKLAAPIQAYDVTSRFFLVEGETTFKTFNPDSKQPADAVVNDEEDLSKKVPTSKINPGQEHETENATNIRDDFEKIRTELTSMQQFKIREPQVKSVLDYYKGLKRLSISYGGRIQLLLRYICCRRKFATRREHKLLDAGIHRMQEALDVRNLMKMEYDLKLLISLLLTKQQRALFLMQRDRVLQMGHEKVVFDESLEKAKTAEELAKGVESDESVDMGEFDTWAASNRVDVDYKRLTKLLSEWQVEGDINKKLMMGTICNRVDKLFGTASERTKRLQLYGESKAASGAFGNLTQVNFVAQNQAADKLNSGKLNDSR